jgi:uncharacterized metal-binding protein YceD (DUF177 family)
MGNKREFEIAFVGLKPGIHNFEYSISDAFFEKFGSQDFTNCLVQVKLCLEKNNGFMLLKFDILGSALVDCDRCGNELHQDLWDEFNVIVKLVDDPIKMNEQEEDPDIYYIGRTESLLHIEDFVYEFVNLSIPHQKMCKNNDAGESLCNNEVLKKLQEMQQNIGSNIGSNPLQKALEQFKNINN